MFRVRSRLLSVFVYIVNTGSRSVEIECKL